MNEKNKDIPDNSKNNTIINVLIIIGLSALLLLMIISLIAMIASLINKNTSILTVSSSIFVSSISSILTILALLLTVKSSDRDYRLRIEEKELSNTKLSKKISSTLKIEKISISESLRPKISTHQNLVNIENRTKKNLHAILFFSAEELDSIDNISLEKFNLSFIYPNKLSNFQIKLEPCESTKSTIHRKSKNGFIYEIVTEIDGKAYGIFNNAFSCGKYGRVKIDSCFKLYNSDETVSAEYNHTRRFDFDKESDDKKWFYFNLDDKH